MTAIKQWQRLAHELAREKGEHSVACPQCADWSKPCGPSGAGMTICPTCNGTRRVEVDHKSPTRIASRLALIHLAISRAVECVVRGETAITMTKCLGRLRGNSNGTFGLDCLTTEQCLAAGWEPQGFPIALADVFIRLCDLAESIGVEIKEPRHPCGLTPCETTEEIMYDLARLHAEVADRDLFGKGFHADLQRGEWFGRVYRRLAAITDELSIDLFAMAELKYAYEKGRAK